MQHTKEQILSIAALSHIAVSEEEALRFSSELSALRSLAERLEPIDGEDEPMTDALPLAALREDTVGECLSRDAILSAAPAHDGVCLLVPRTVEDSE